MDQLGTIRQKLAVCLEVLQSNDKMSLKKIAYVVTTAGGLVTQSEIFDYGTNSLDFLAGVISERYPAGEIYAIGMKSIRNGDGITYTINFSSPI